MPIQVKKKYNDHAVQLIRVWFLNPATKMNPNMDFGQAIKGENTGRGAGLIDARNFIKVIEAIELMHKEGVYPKEDRINMQAWFLDFLNWMQTSKNGKNYLFTLFGVCDRSFFKNCKNGRSYWC